LFSSVARGKATGGNEKPKSSLWARTTIW
jgi:hypothetical protein